MNKWYQEIIVEHKEIDNKMYHCFDDENFEKLTNERNEQLKEIERLNKCYCERTDCSGRIKNSKKYESMQEEIERLKEEYIITCKQKNKYISTLEESLNIAEERYLRLNNIINELENYLEKTIIDGGTRGSMTFWYRQIYDYLQELKGSEKE